MASEPTDVEPAAAGTSSADLRRQAGPHVFVTDLDAPRLDPADEHHLTKALRLRPGAPLTLSDAEGRWCTARFGPDPERTGPVHAIDPPAWPCGLAVALTKGAKPELVVQKATELGIDRVVIFEADHSVPSWDEPRRAKATTRLARVAREAAMQSRQVRIPEVTVVGGLDAVRTALGPVPMVRADSGGRPIGDADRIIAIGPEGGWSANERSEVPGAVDLGPSVLRAETAAIVAASHLAQLRNRAS